MTIYWERCGICGRYHVTKQCTMYPDLMVCPHCCLTCIHRSKCPRPVWYPTIRLKPIPQVVRKKSSDEAKKVLLDLLSKLDKGVSEK